MSKPPGDRIARSVFFGSVILLAFFSGAVVTAYRLPPYWHLKQAKSAIVALTKLEDDTLVAGLVRVDPEAPVQPRAQQLDPSAGSEPLLLTGGFFQDMEECPRFGCIARVIDRSGNTLFKWEIDPDDIAEVAPENFAGRFSKDNLYPVGLSLLKDGDLVVTFHARNSFPYQAGIARIGKTGLVKWVRLDHSHHWLDTDPDGTSYTPVTRVVTTPSPVPGTSVYPRCHDDMTFDEGVRVRDARGEILQDYWFSDILAASGFPGLFYSVRDGCDPFHINSVELVSEDAAATLEGVKAGDFLVSLREPGLVAVLGADDGLIKYSAIGRTAAQHSPHFLTDGTVAVFDNLGAPQGDQAGTRIQRLDLRTGRSTTIYPRDGLDRTIPLWSEDGGHLSISPDGQRMMISSKSQSRSFEIDIGTGKPLWSLDIGYDISKYLDQEDKKAEAERAWFNAYGVYYLTPLQLAFLNE